MKSNADYFADWEGHAFGFGYGTGEAHVLSALKLLMAAVGDEDSADAYRFEALETAVGHAVAWLLINRLCTVGILEYGTSPRYGWLTEWGVALRDYLASRSAGELCDDVIGRDENYHHCYQDRCNCDGPTPCQNPFWPKLK